MLLFTQEFPIISAADFTNKWRRRFTNIKDKYYNIMITYDGMMVDLFS